MGCNQVPEEQRGKENMVLRIVAVAVDVDYALEPSYYVDVFNIADVSEA
jgi:hypothetical protein